MSTTTKPRRTEVSTVVTVQRFTDARKAIAAAKRKASRIAADKTGIPSASTRGRSVLKVKADAFDAVDLILAGKDAD